MLSKKPASPDTVSSSEFAHDTPDLVVIPVIEEQLRVGTESVETGRVRVSKRVEVTEQVINVPLKREIVDVQRIPIDRVVEQVPLSRQEGDTLILPVVREEVITTIRLILVEEVHITRRQEETIDQQTVSLRREIIAVDRTDSFMDQTTPSTDLLTP